MTGWAKPVLGDKNDEVLVQEAPLRLAPGEPLRLRIFLDGCMLEVFANGRQALCQQIWPTRDDSLDIRFLARDGDARVNTLKAWEMKAASAGIPGNVPLPADAGPLADAIALWHMEDLSEATGNGRALSVEGKVEVGVPLSGSDRKASLARGGDGYAAQFDGGWLDVGQDKDDGLDLNYQSSFTMLARIKSAGTHIDGSLFTRWTFAPQMAIDLSAWYMPWSGLSRWNLGLAASRDPKANYWFQCDGGHLRLEKEDHTGWQDIVIRVNKEQIKDSPRYLGTWPTTDMFVNGILRRRSYSAGKAAWIQRQIFVHNEPGSRIGAEPGGRAPFKGLIDHVALWDRALSDQEIGLLSGGLIQPEPVQIQPHGKAKTGGALLPDQMPQEQRCRLLDENVTGALEDLLTDQPFFPRYHIALPGVVMNTHGIVHNQLHHMFPILESTGKWYPPIDIHYYGHIASPDLVQWKMMPIPFRKPIFPNGTFVFGPDEGMISNIAGPGLEMATSTDPELAFWNIETKRPRIVNNAPDGFKFRDNGIFKYKNTWYMAAQSHPSRKKDHRIVLYKSDDLMNWSFVSVMGDDLHGECLQVLPFKDKLILFLADRGYVVGNFDGQQFQQLVSGRVRYGSGRTLQYPVIDSSGNFVVLWDVFYNHIMSAAKEDTKRGFTCAYGLPLQIAFRDDHTLAFNPIEAIKTLRGKHVALPLTDLEANEVGMIKGLGGAQLEIQADFDCQQAKIVGILLEQGRHKTEIRYNAQRHQAELDVSRMPYLPGYYRNKSLIVRAPLPGKAKGKATLRVFYDSSLVEVFVNGVRLMEWTLFEQPDQVKAGVFARDGSARLNKLDAWQMRSIWPELKSQEGVRP